MEILLFLTGLWWVSLFLILGGVAFWPISAYFFLSFIPLCCAWAMLVSF